MAYRMQESLPPVVKNLFIVNGLVFLAQYVMSAQGILLEQWGALWPVRSDEFRIWQLVTHMFMHGNFPHIFFNMFNLYMFGTTVEYTWGSKRFLEFYLICGIVAGAAQLSFSPDGPALGASGAVMGVMVAFAYLYPNRPLYLYFLVPIKAKYIIMALVAIDLFSGIDPSRTDNIAHFAHLGGAVAGFALAYWYGRRSRRSNY